MIPYGDLIKLLAHFVACDTINNFFFPAVDGSNFPLEVVLRALSRTVSGNVKVVSMTDAHDAWMNDKPTLNNTWNLDLLFTDQLSRYISLDYANGLYKCAKDVWNQYRTTSAPTPRSVMISGPPSSLKTTIARALALQ